jgi:hypothetical protein
MDTKVSVIETNRKVKVTDSRLGSVGARLSNTASGRAQSMANHPAGKGRERTVLEGLLLNSTGDREAEYEAAIAWLDEYQEVHAQIEARKANQAKVDAERRRKFLADANGFDS